jgi:hypothetical protein
MVVTKPGEKNGTVIDQVTEEQEKAEKQMVQSQANFALGAGHSVRDQSDNGLRHHSLTSYDSSHEDENHSLKPIVDPLDDEFLMPNASSGNLIIN